MTDTSAALRLTAMLLCGALLTACGDDEAKVASGDPQLDKAIAFLQRTSSEDYIRKHDSVFLSLDGIAHSPSDWAGYAFSTLGTRTWVHEGTEEASYRVPGMKLIPKGVSMFPGSADEALEAQPNYETLKSFNAQRAIQVMVVPDDDAGTVKVKAYRNWQEPPIYETTWAFPKF